MSIQIIKNGVVIPRLDLNSQAQKLLEKLTSAPLYNFIKTGNVFITSMDRDTTGNHSGGKSVDFMVGPQWAMPAIAHYLADYDNSAFLSVHNNHIHYQSAPANGVRGVERAYRLDGTEIMDDRGAGLSPDKKYRVTEFWEGLYQAMALYMISPLSDDYSNCIDALKIVASRDASLSDYTGALALAKYSLYYNNTYPTLLQRYMSATKETFADIADDVASSWDYVKAAAILAAITFALYNIAKISGALKNGKAN